MRQIIQIAASQALFYGENTKRLYALCDDGTVWVTGRVKGIVWEKLPEIPQDKGNVTLPEVGL